MNYLLEYINKIENGEIVVGKKVSIWYLEHIKPIVLGKNDKYYFDEEKAMKFINFSKFCCNSKGKWAGKPIELLLFQKAKYQAIFGILDRETHRRRFKEIFDVRGRKNGKSTENSVLGLYLAIEEPGAEIYVAATTYQQARHVWDDSVTMIDLNKSLSKRFNSKVNPCAEIYTTKQVRPIKSTFKVLSSNVKAFDGLNVSGAIIDEVHELNRGIYDILKQATSVREEPLLSMITTSGFVRGGLFDDMYEYSKKVIEKVHEDDSLFPLIYELDSIDEMQESANHIKANPALGAIKRAEDLIYNVDRAKIDLNFANTVKVKDFNVIGVDNSAWLPYEVFNVETKYSLEQMKKYDDTVVIGGFDLSQTGDMTAFTTMFFDKENRIPICETMYWITDEFFKKNVSDQSNKVPWGSWVERGLVRISGTTKIDYHDVANYVFSEMYSEHGYIYQYINYDSYSAQYLVEELDSLGFKKDYCLIPTQQGYKTLSIPMQTLESLLKEKKICYQNNPVTKWCLSNIELDQDRNGNYLPKKNKDNQKRKIDGAATILNCLVSYCKNIDYFYM